MSNKSDEVRAQLACNNRVSNINDSQTSTDNEDAFSRYTSEYGRNVNPTYIQVASQKDGYESDTDNAIVNAKVGRQSSVTEVEESAQVQCVQTKMHSISEEEHLDGSIECKNSDSRRYTDSVKKGKEEQNRLIEEGTREKNRLANEGEKEQKRLIEEGIREKNRLIEEGIREKNRLANEGEKEQKRLIEEGRREKNRLIEEGNHLANEGEKEQKRLIEEGRSGKIRLIHEGKQERKLLIQEAKIEMSREMEYSYNKFVEENNTMRSEITKEAVQLQSKVMQSMDGSRAKIEEIYACIKNKLNDVDIAIKEVNTAINETQGDMRLNLRNWQGEIYRSYNKRFPSILVSLERITNSIEDKIREYESQQKNTEDLQTIVRNLSRLKRNFEIALSEVSVVRFTPNIGATFDPRYCTAENINEDREDPEDYYGKRITRVTESGIAEKDKEDVLQYVFHKAVVEVEK